jgi:hypothetical protein
MLFYYQYSYFNTLYSTFLSESDEYYVQNFDITFILRPYLDQIFPVFKSVRGTLIGVSKSELLTEWRNYHGVENTIKSVT